MDVQVSTTQAKMSAERKAELFDKFVLKLASYASADDLVKYLMGILSEDEIFNSDYEAVFNDFLEPFVGDEICEILKVIIQKVMEEDLGAKKVSIEW